MPPVPLPRCVDPLTGGGSPSNSEDSLCSSDSVFREAMRRKGLPVVDVEPDGNCLFRSVSHQIYGDVDRHAQVRSRFLRRCTVLYIVVVRCVFLIVVVKRQTKTPLLLLDKSCTGTRALTNPYCQKIKDTFSLIGAIAGYNLIAKVYNPTNCLVLSCV